MLKTLKRVKSRNRQLSELKLPDYFTIIGMCLALASIFFSTEEKFWTAYFLILGQFFFDAVDGRVARRYGGGELGVFLDSFSDFTAITAVVFLGIYIGIENFWMYMVSLLFLIAAAVRLSFFMAQALKGKVSGFTGVPTVLAVIILATLIMLNYKFQLSDMNRLTILYFVLAYAMVSNLKIKKI